MDKHLHFPQTYESLKVNEDRKELLRRWIVSTIDEGDFEVNRIGLLEEFLTKFKQKSEVSSWRKCAELWEEEKQESIWKSG